MKRDSPNLSTESNLPREMPRATQIWPEILDETKTDNGKSSDIPFECVGASV